MRTWPLQEARAHLRDVVDGALSDGPQRITRHGKPAVIVVAEADWNNRAVPHRSFGELLAASPLRAADRPPRRAARAIRRGMFE